VDGVAEPLLFAAELLYAHESLSPRELRLDESGLPREEQFETKTKAVAAIKILQ
jgi:hypothetical protein